MERTKIFHFQRRQISAKAIPLSLDIIDKGNVALVLVTTRRKSCIDVGGVGEVYSADQSIRFTGP